MNSHERLREALLELETLRQREADRFKEISVLLKSLEALSSGQTVEAGLELMLETATKALGCDGIVLMEASDDGLQQCFPVSSTRDLWNAPGLLRRPRRIVDLQAGSGALHPLPEMAKTWRAALSHPLTGTERQTILLAHSEQPGHFSASNATLLGRLAAIVGQAMVHRALEQRSVFLASVIDHSPISVAIAEANGDQPLIYVNDAFTQLSGLTSDRVLGKNCRFMAVEQPDHPTRKAIRDTVREKRAGNYVVRNRRVDGSTFWNEIRFFPILDDLGVSSHIVATQTDVTARIEAENERDTARERLETALRVTPDAYLVLGSDDRVQYFNTPFAKHFGDREVVLGAKLPIETLAVLLSIDKNDVPVTPVEVFRVGGNREITARDGSVMLLRTRAMPDGSAMLSATDITKVKVNERALQQRLAAIDRSPDGIAIGDADGRVMTANPSLVALWNLQEETQALGQHWYDFYVSSPSASSVHWIESFTNSPEGWSGEVTLDNSGVTRVHDVSFYRVHDVGSILTVRDITDRLSVEAERNEMRRLLDHAQTQEKIHLTSVGIAHDFNNILSAIQGSAAIIGSFDGQPGETTDAAKRIQTAASRAADLVDGLLAMGARNKQTEDLNIANIVRSTVDLARGTSPRNAQITFDVLPDVTVVRMSRTDILQVLMNLIVNGVDALGGHPGEVRVHVRPDMPPAKEENVVAGRFAPQMTYLTIGVEDSGAGMPPELLTRIAEPYFTTKGNTGTGLGLAIVASIVEEAGAVLTIDSQLNRGTKMRVYWPMNPTQDPLPAPDVAHEDRSHLSVLVLDDDVEVAQGIACMLTRAGFEVVETDDPGEAVEAICESPDSWGCLVSDYDMPELTGGDVIERLAEHAESIPVVIVSALARRLGDRRLQRAARVLQKPVEESVLVAAVRRATGADTASRDTGGGSDENSAGG